jgi:hypothetical protein
MNPEQIERLFKAARAEPAPIPGEGFERRVLSAIAREPTEATVAELISRLLSRLAASAAVVIVLCVAADICLSNFVQPDFNSGLTQLAEQWLFAAN